MEIENGEFRKWDELLHDALGLIFKNLTLHELLVVIPTVCKSWGKAVNGSYCWQEIDIEEWSRNSQPELVDKMLQLLIKRSCGSPRKITVSGLSTEQSIILIANHAQSLETLRIPRSEITDSIVEKVVSKLSSITNLDISYCINIGSNALELIGKHCKLLTSLRRVMHPLEVIDKLSQDDEALAIANTMPRLKHLEIAYLLVDTVSIMEILKKCNNLEFLDVRGCWSVDLDDKFLKSFSKLKIVGPHVIDCHDTSGRDSYSDYSGSSGYLAWDFVAGDLLDGYDYDPETMDEFWEEQQEAVEEVEMWFYDDFNVDSGHGWPQSP